MAKTETKEQVVQEAVAEKNPLVASVTPSTDAFISRMLPPKSARDLWAGLPDHISKDVFKRNLYNALTSNPKLMDYNPALVFREVSKAAAMGLLLDPLLGEAYMIEAYNYKTKATEPQLRIGYKGMIRLARQSGNVTGVWSHEVHENDEVEADLGFPKRYSHRPALFTERGKIIGYTAVVTYKDGGFDFEPMSLKDCLAIRDRSDAYKAFKKGLIKSTPWDSDEGEMCKKTAFRRLMKRQDQSPELRMAQQIEDAADFPHMINGSSAPAIKAPAPPPSLEHQPDKADANTSKTKSTRSRSGGEKADEKKTGDAIGAVKWTGPVKELFAIVQKECDAADFEADPECFNAIRSKFAPMVADLFPPDKEEVEGIITAAEEKFAP